MTLVTGEVIKADLVIAADGIHSRAVEVILGTPNPPLPQKQDNFVFRFLIPTVDIEADEETKFWLEEGDGCMKMILGKRKRIVSYPCRE